MELNRGPRPLWVPPETTSTFWNRVRPSPQNWPKPVVSVGGMMLAPVPRLAACTPGSTGVAVDPLEPGAGAGA